MKKLFVYADEKSATNYLKAIENSQIPCKITLSLNPTECVNHSHLLLCGGGDVNPIFYGERETFCNDVDYNKDLAELFLINYFYKNNLPILGVCRGMQIINVAFGGNLKQTLKEHYLHHEKNIDLFHPLEITGGLLKSIYGELLFANSAHRQAVNLLGRNLIPTAYSDDLICEAFEHKNGKIFGVQFHPERMCKKGLLIYKNFLETN